jgi:outer membrane protein assembly factor BamE (lipoprotein component of BamABCDE complex)
MKLYYIAVLSIVLMLVSCSSTGNHIDLDMVKQNIKIGESKKDDVLKVCGEPLIKDADMKNDTEMWHYARVEKNVTGLGVLTHVVGFGSETKSDKTVLDVYFSKGVVVDMKIESASTTKMHLK